MWFHVRNKDNHTDEVFIGGKSSGIGSGKTKKGAEQKAAYEAIKLIKSKKSVLK